MLRILVIEDSPVNMALTTAILENAGHVILQAETATAGIELARRQCPDLVLMDLQLPDIDGLAATRMLKADRRTSDIPVIALTAFAMKGDEDETRSAGCDGYVTKPMRYKDFLAEVERVLGARRGEVLG
ncbi:response regulator [Piscinibacter sp.]|jgi:two-component system cell cycle response regulator DivK|uniref:response regulator n=1 Tax=Piscinibacter sp. TaxID=1903157 RepID=UPI002F3EBF24